MSDNEMQSNEKADTRTVTILAEIWHALLEIAGRQIDRENAEVYWSFGQAAGPYGVYPDPPSEYDCVVRSYFARNSESSVWIEFGVLADATTEAFERNSSNSLEKLDDEDVLLAILALTQADVHLRRANT
jgi:hypothetical protein